MNSHLLLIHSRLTATHRRLETSMKEIDNMLRGLNPEIIAFFGDTLYYALRDLYPAINSRTSLMPVHLPFTSFNFGTFQDRISFGTEMRQTLEETSQIEESRRIQAGGHVFQVAYSKFYDQLVYFQER